MMIRDGLNEATYIVPVRMFSRNLELGTRYIMPLTLATF